MGMFKQGGGGTSADAQPTQFDLSKLDPSMLQGASAGMTTTPYDPMRYQAPRDEEPQAGDFVRSPEAVMGPSNNRPGPGMRYRPQAYPRPY
jgi:hypothetical protein